MQTSPMDFDNDDLYHEELMDHFHHPHNAGRLASPTFVREEQNPLCGDLITLCVQLDRDRRVTDVRFQGHGCAISQASASIFTDAVKGKTLSEIAQMTPDTMQRLLGVRLSPTRLKCALLAMRAFGAGADHYLHLQSHL